MEFCDVCDNMLYMKSDNNLLVKFCKHCNFQKEVNAQNNGPIKISQTLYSEDDLLYMQYQNKYLRYDPTYQRIQDPSIVCPNQSCTGSKDVQQVLYVKYHPVHMKYLFCCDHCGFMWRLEDARV